MIQSKSWFLRLKRELAAFGRWFLPGLGVKRWLGFVLLGVTLIGIGLAYLLLDIYRTAPNVDILQVIDVASLRTFPRPVRVAIFVSVGFVFVGWGIWGVNKALLNPFLRKDKKLVDQIADFRRKQQGAKVVVMGGGHGMATLLRGLKEQTHNLTAVVTVADDGGSSGRLRRELGILPPGDIRNCLAALSNDEALLTQLFQYRFNDTSGLGGHSFGNLFISALVDVTGSFETAIEESGSVLSVHGKVMPATLDDVTLVADVQCPEMVQHVRIFGESRIPQKTGRVRRVYLEPNHPAAYPPVINTILNADLIVVGPGSLYTSLLPNMLVPDILAALRASRALKVFVINIATQDGETAGYGVAEHIQAVRDHIGNGVFDLFLCNNNHATALPEGVNWVKQDKPLGRIPIYGADLVDEEHPWRHDSAKLAGSLMNILYEKTGPLTE